jgi:hypothetical protein
VVDSTASSRIRWAAALFPPRLRRGAGGGVFLFGRSGRGDWRAWSWSAGRRQRPGQWLFAGCGFPERGWRGGGGVLVAGFSPPASPSCWRELRRHHGVREACRSWLLPAMERRRALLQLFLGGFLQVCVLALAGVRSLTVGTNRGDAPADVLPSGLRSRRSRRVATAAISTRWLPLKVCSGDLAAAWVVFDADAAAAGRAAADLVMQSWPQGSGCNFFVSQGLFCKVWNSCAVSGCFLYARFLT